jgi:hypothetical protein
VSNTKIDVTCSSLPAASCLILDGNEGPSYYQLRQAWYHIQGIRPVQPSWISTAKMNHVSFPPRPPPPNNQQPETISKPRKLRRISRACDFCHKRSIRCKPSTEDASRCQNCLDFGVSCTYNRPAKKRGIKSGSAKASSENAAPNDGERDARMLLELTNGIQGMVNFNVVGRFLIPEKWNTMVLANEGKIRDLVEVYFEVVYPM